MDIKIEMSEDDFTCLWTNSARWAGSEMHDHEGRFEHTTETFDTPPRWNWKHAYWVGDSWAVVILARAWLTAQGHGCEVVWDTGNDEYVILTDYEDA